MRSKIKKSVAYIMCLTMMLSAGMTSVYSEDAPAEEEAETAEAAEEEEEEEEVVPRTEEEAMAVMEEVASKGDLTLYYSKDEGSMALEDKKSGKIWWSNPVDYETSKASKTQKEELRSTITLTYCSPQARNTTTTHSASGAKTDVKEIENGIQITYRFDTPGITIPVQYVLMDGYLKAYINTDEIVEDNPSNVSGLLVTNIAVMPTFGASGKTEDGYFVVPDGCGAVIDFNNGKTNLREYDGKVYGRDITAVKKSKPDPSQKVSLPMYGIVKEDAALMVVADKGDTAANINTYVSGQRNTDYNSAYFDFELRTSDEYLMGGDSNPLKVFEKRGILVPEVEVRYYPVAADEQLDYIDVADSYRDYLINDKAVVDKDLTDTVSLYMDLYGGTLKTESIAGLPVTIKEKVTSFSTAKYLLESLNSMGIDDMVVTYNKFANDDIGEKITDSFNPSSKLGGKSGFNELMSYASANNIKLFPSIDNQQFKTGNGYWNMTNTSNRVSNAYAQIPVYDLAHGIENQYYKPLSLFTPASYDKAFSKLIKSYNKKGVTNFAFGSLANTIYGDYGKKAVSREMAKGYVQNIYSSAKQSGSVIAANASAYVLPYADYIADMPIVSSKFDIFDQEIPFYQMVMHGVTPYAATAVNAEANLADSALTALAAGSNLSFDFVGIEASELKDTKLDMYYYGYYANWVNEATGLYKLSNEVLAPASDAKIVSYTISDDENEIETVYDNGYTTVVNFEDKTIKADGKTYKLVDYIGEEVIGL